MKNLLVTGGAGFIGSHFSKIAIKKGYNITVLDKLTYSGSKENLLELKNVKEFEFIQGSILDEILLSSIFKKKKYDAILNFAAETHVDRSIENSSEFILTNVLGVQKLVSFAMDLFLNNRDFKFIQISTDEVFGSIAKGNFTEDSKYDPNSPYAASKAGGDHIVSSYCRTFNFPGIITNCSNNYGGNQFPEKLVPLLIIKAIQNKSLPIYGNGKQMRDWLHVDDHCKALMILLEKGIGGERYLIGGNNCIQNIEMAKNICKILDEVKPLDNKKYGSLIKFVEDRPGHDQRYSIDSSKIQNILGWSPKITFQDGLKETVNWYVNNKKIWEKIIRNNYSGERIGLR